MSSPYLEKLREAGKNREALYAEIYDGLCANDDAKLDSLPSRRRQKRIRLYKFLIGKGHDRILEIGCGLGDLSLALSGNAVQVIGTDVSGKIVGVAAKRLERLRKGGAHYNNVAFHRMGATDIRYENELFDWVVSTSLIEHLHPEDIEPHLNEVYRILRKGGRYLVWAPNRLGHHGDRDIHLSMLSHGDLVEVMRRAGFQKFQTTPFYRPRLIDVRWKILLERWLSICRVRVFWSHLGIRNLLVVAEK